MFEFTLQSFTVVLELIKSVFVAVLSIQRSLTLQNNLSINNQLCLVRPARISLKSIELHCCSFKITLDKDRYVRSSYAIDDLSDRLCIPDKAEDTNAKVLYTITGVLSKKYNSKQNDVKR